jgi:hypothetical protein
VLRHGRSYILCLRSRSCFYASLPILGVLGVLISTERRSFLFHFIALYTRYLLSLLASFSASTLGPSLSSLQFVLSFYVHIIYTTPPSVPSSLRTSSLDLHSSFSIHISFLARVRTRVFTFVSLFSTFLASELHIFCGHTFHSLHETDRALRASPPVHSCTFKRFSIYIAQSQTSFRVPPLSRYMSNVTSFYNRNLIFSSMDSGISEKA